jgi:hypothetical protein
MGEGATKIRNDIERTREEMSDTLDAMRWKMDVKHRAVDGIRNVKFDKRTVGIVLAIATAAFWPKRALMLGLFLHRRRHSPVVKRGLKGAKQFWSDHK